MTKISLYIFLLLMVYNIAYSEWIEISHSNTATIYVDPKTVTNDEETKYVWVLIDQKEKTDNTKSRTVHIQIDCNKGKNRLHFIVLYNAQMGKGDEINRVTSPTEWRSILPGSVGYDVKEFICS